MSDSNDDKENTEETDAAWWDRKSFAGALGDFRDALKSDPLGSEAVHKAWTRVGMVGYVRGGATEAGLTVCALHRRLSREGRSLWGREIPAVCAIVHFKLVLALGESPQVSRDVVEEATGHFETAARSCCVAEEAVALLRLALAIRLGDLDRAGGLFPPLHDWCLRLLEEGESKGIVIHPVCESGIGQILAEYLFAAGRVEEALQLAGKLLERKGCDGPCEAGPHALLGWMLGPLRERGEHRRAADLLKRSRLGAPAGDPRHVGAAGDRVRHLAETGRAHEAGAELEGVRSAIERAAPAEWQRLRAAGQVAAAWPRIAAADPGLSPGLRAFARDLASSADDLASRFDRRNGNRTISELWPSRPGFADPVSRRGGGKA